MVNPVSIILRRRTAVVVAPVTGEKKVTHQSFKVVADLENRLERLGYTLDEKVVESMLVKDAGRTAEYADTIVADVAQLVGAVDRNGKAAPVKPVVRKRNWRPCGYPGCNPTQCDECDGEGA